MLGLPRQERGELVLVEHVERLVAGDVLLEEAEAEGVDGADEQPSDQVEDARADELRGAHLDPVAQLLCGPLRERERDDRPGVGPVREEPRDALRHDLSLPRPRGGDDLDVRPAVQHRVERLPLQDGRRHRGPLLIARCAASVCITHPPSRARGPPATRRRT